MKQPPNPSSSQFVRFIPYGIILAFVVWMYLFQGFITSQKTLVGDAVNYFEHTAFYINNISRGVYPMWEATRDYGVPTEFYMRRIGEFNPFYSVMVVFQKLGMAPLDSYQAFLVLYFFVGMIGFYQLSRLVFNDVRIAFLSYLGILFSSLGTVLYCSFTHVIFVPMFWFFYFLLKFVRSPEKSSFLGLIFTLMVLVSTYIPFYFLTVFLVFLILFVGLYFQEWKNICGLAGTFIHRHKLFVTLSVVILILSCWPGYQFYLESKTGEMVLPTRNYAAQTESILGVPAQRGEFGGIIPHLILEEMFLDLHKMKLSLVYTPWLVHIFFFLGLMVALTRRLALLFLWGFIIFLFSLYDAAIYKFFYEHVFYFKYFRNFQFFFWLAVLPLFVLVAMEHFKVIVERRVPSLKEGRAMIPGFVLIHAGFLFFLIKQEHVLVTSYVCVGLSFLFFLSYSLGWFVRREQWAWLILVMAMIVQPVHVFYYLDKNAVNLADKDWYRDHSAKEKPYLTLVLPEVIEEPIFEVKASSLGKVAPSYLGTYWYDYLRRNMNPRSWDIYFSSPLLIYDHVERMDLSQVDLDRIDEAWRSRENTVFVPEGVDLQRNAINKKTSKEVLAVTTRVKEVEIVSVDVNHLKVKTSFDADKFLVWNNNFHAGWRAWVNGKEEKLYRANISFQGVKLPAGENVVLFQYGSPVKYVLKWVMIFLYHFVLGWLIYLSVQRFKERLK